MEKNISHAVRILKIQYFLFWLIPVLLVTAFETDILPTGIYATDPGKQYIWETAGILLAIACVPLSLKLFSLIKKRKVDTFTFPVALKSYCFWSGARLMILELVVIFNVVVYYFTLNNIGGLCALIGVTASAFCLPGEKRLREEMNIAKRDSDEKKLSA